MAAVLDHSRTLAALIAGGLSVPLAVQAQSLSQLACAAGVHCANAVTPQDAQIVLNITPEQAQARFIEASQDWDAAVWRCAAGGRTCGAISQLDAQIVIGLPEAAYGPAEQLRERGPGAAPTPPSTPVATPKSPSQGARQPGIAIESMPAPGAGAYQEIPMPAGNPAAAADIQPLDGVWTLRPGTPVAKGCMAGIAQSVASSMPGPQSGPATFEKPFNAQRLVKSDKLIWKRVGPNHYAAQLAASSTAMTMAYDVRVTSASAMQWQSVVTVRIPGQPVCTIATPLSYTRQGS